MPVARCITEKATLVPRPSTLSPSRPGMVSNCSERESMNSDSRSRRVEEVERVAARRGVEHEQVVAALAGSARRASPSPCTPASRPRRSRAPGRCGWRGPRRACARRARATRSARRRCAWRRASSPTARRSTGAISTRRSSLPSSAQAERVGEPPRRVDRHHRHLAPARRHPQRDRRRGRRLAHAARAGADADLLALEPVLDHRISSSSIGQQLDLAPARLRLEQVRQRASRARVPRRAGARAAPAVPTPGGARRARPARAVFSRTSRRRRTLGCREALRQHARWRRSGRRACRGRRRAGARGRPSR